MKSFLINCICPAVAYAVIVIGCGSGSGQDDTKLLGFSQCISDHPWREAMNRSMRIQASLHPDIRLEIHEAHSNIQKQIADIHGMIEKGVDVIIISPLEADSLIPVIHIAMENDIPVLLLDRKVNSPNYTAYVGGDNFMVGQNVAKYIISDAQGPASVLEISGNIGTSAVERSLGLHQALEESPNIRIDKQIYISPDGAQFREFAQYLDTTTVLPDYVYGFNDDTAHMLWEIAKSKGLEKDMKFIGTDGLNIPDGGISLVKRGILEATILYPTGGSEAIGLALEILSRGSIAKNQILNTVVIDRLNADIMQDQFNKIDEQQTEIEHSVLAIRDQQQRYLAQSRLFRITLGLLLIVIGLTAYFIYSVRTIRKKNRQLVLSNDRITIQRNQIEKIAKEARESNEAKINFFTGISHEFKTPITLIISSLETIRDYLIQHNSKSLYEISLIERNSSRLLRLVNNLLDFRKVEDQKFNLRVSRTNIYNFTAHVCNDFRREAMRRNITFNLLAENQQIDLYIDRELMDKVYFNLLSNAFKFTPENGRIDVSIEDWEADSFVTIRFRDNGIGIPAAELDNVFKAFFKGSNNRRNSSGIGLHLSKVFVELHLGKIRVQSNRGTEFIITLFKGKSHFNEDQIIVEPEFTEARLGAHDIEFSGLPKVYGESEEGHKPTILCIEDNRELLIFLQNNLREEYQVRISEGRDGAEMAFEIIPDVIICDVNLPEKDGFEICRILKKDLRTSHIPVIILTAMDDRNSYIRGLESGADLYLTKPFNYSILAQSIRSLLYNREKLRFYYTNNIHRIESTKNFGNPEQTFICTINEIISENLENSDFSVEQLANSLFISRSQLYRKVKALLGISISDYINDYKLERAKNLLLKSEMHVSEVAYANGFSSPNYFSTAFKQKYGTSPDTFRREQRESSEMIR